RAPPGALPPLATFAAARFGIDVAGRGPDEPALVPLTLRHVQADLAGARTGGQIALRRLGPEVDDATLLGWIARVRRWHENTLGAREAGRPQSEWFTTVNETDARGRPRAVKVERTIATRELSLLAGDAEARRTGLPEAATAAPRATEVVGVPVPARGYHVLEVESRILGESLLAARAPMYVRTGALVTNLAVHFKGGRTSSLVWVTRLDRGRPVADARVAVNDCNGKVLWSGRTDAAGIARIDRGFPDDVERCPTPDGLFVTARHGEGAAADLAFVFSRWNRGIEPWRFGLATSSEPVPDRRAHTVFDRTLLRAGETVSMKHFVREETPRGLALPVPDALPDRVRITHVGSGSEVVQPLAWPRGARSAESRWAIPATAALGLYDVVLLRGDRAWGSGSFRVEAFRVPLVDARLAAPRGLQVAPAQLAFEVQLAALAGGPMPGAALELSALMRPRVPRFAGHEEFAFEPPRERPDPSRAADAEEEAPDTARVVASRLPARTDARGAARVVVDRLPPVTQPAELLAELAFDDPNGERQTVAQRVALWPSAVVVGIRLPGWAAGRGDARYTVVVLDTEGRPLKDRAVAVTARQHRTLSTRTRLVGGFYAYDNQHTLRELGEVCRGRTDARGRLECESRFTDGGEIELVAASADDAGRAARAAASLWVSTGERWWFAQDNDDRIDILPEQRELAPGATARLQVRMPYAQATALVTVEREGVLDARVVTLAGRQPVIELPIPAGGGADSWAPNVHVGVLVLRGRLREAPWWSLFTWGWRDPLDWWQAFRHEGREYRAPTALVDLARPGFKFGVASLTVGLDAHRLAVAVTPAKTTAAVREVVPVTVRVAQGGKPVAG
ncbi:MAG: MG2 domain-containing protein, partial [Rubrivivax sp.]